MKEGHDATLQAIKLTLLSEKMELTCDPYFGTRLKEYFYSKGNLILKDIIIDDIYVALTTFVPQIKIERTDIDIEIDKTQVNCTIKCINRLNYTVDLYDIELTKEEV